jgi:hypothetical protein
MCRLSFEKKYATSTFEIIHNNPQSYFICKETYKPALTILHNNPQLTYLVNKTVLAWYQ